MRILSVLGSPNKEGNTAALLKEYLKGVKENHNDVELTNIFLRDEEINFCTACNACKSNKEKTCIINDDMHKYYEKINSADLIIFATPIYWFNMTAQLKTFIDRMYALNFENFPKGKKLTLLTTFGDDDKVIAGAINVTSSIKDMTKYMDIEFIHDFGVSSSIPVANNKNALAEVRALGRTLIIK